MAPAVQENGTSWCGTPAEDPSLSFPPLSEAFRVYPPLGNDRPGAPVFYENMIDFVKITVCETIDGGACNVLAELSSGPAHGGRDAIRIVDSRFTANWKIERDSVGRNLEIRFSVAGLELGYVPYVPAAERTLPIKFIIEDHPRVRARLLHEQGHGAMDVARILADDYGLSARGTVQILSAEGYDKVDIGRVLRDLFKASPEESAQILKDLCYSAADTAEIFKALGDPVQVIYDVLKSVYGLSDREIEVIFDSIGFDENDYIDITAHDTVLRFAPVLYFDRAMKGFPMSADDYFRNMLTPAANGGDNTITWTTPWNGPPQNPAEGIISVCGRDECNNGMSNGSFPKLLIGEVPTYYKAVSDIHADNTGRLRIAYWWFYGFQFHCNGFDIGDDGAHHGDWEHVVVTTDPERSRAEYVTYYFHSFHYTRKDGGIPLHPGTERPVAYVGKLGHGSYHSNEISGWMVGTPHHCCEYADYRNPVSGSVWSNVQDNLVSLRGNAESWLAGDRVGSPFEYGGRSYKVKHWLWGPHISYCAIDTYLFGCADWEHTNACSTHPTVATLDWNMRSCSGGGCGTNSCKGLVYTHDADYNQSWPWDYPAALLDRSVAEPGAARRNGCGGVPVLSPPPSGNTLRFAATGAGGGPIDRN